MTPGDRHPHVATPAGVRDMLPEEMEEVSGVVRPFRETLEAAQFRQIHTPALEFESVMALGDVDSTEPAFRLFDERGRAMVLRSDLTIPIARVVATRYRAAEGPLRFYYVSHVYRGRPDAPGHPREFLQCGAELVGRPGAPGTVELLSTLVGALGALQLERYTILLGDSTLFPRLLDNLGVAEPTRSQLLQELVTRDLAGFRRFLDEGLAAGHLSKAAGEVALRAAYTRGDASLFAHLDPVLREVGDGLERLLDEAGDALRRRIRVDFALLRKLGYYTGEVFEVHHAGLGEPLGGGGRYDTLVERFARDAPDGPDAEKRSWSAVGFGLTVERLHEALRSDGALEHDAAPGAPR